MQKSFRAISRRNMASITFSQFGNPAAVLKISDKNENQLASGVTVSVKSSEILTDDIRSILGQSLNRRSVGTAGETGVGVVASTDISNVKSLRAGETVFVVGSGAWTDKNTFAPASVFKVPKLQPAQAASLSSALLAYGLLTKFAKLKKGDNVYLSNTSSAVHDKVKALAKHYGFNVVEVSTADLGSKDVLTKIKEKQPIHLAISTNDPVVVKGFYRALSTNSHLVIYNDYIESSLESIDGLHLSVASSVFKNDTVSGLNLTRWAELNPEEFQQAVDEVSKLIDLKVFGSEAKTFPYVQFKEAINASLQKKAAILTF